MIKTYPDALSDRYEIEKDNGDLNRRFKVLNEDVEDLVKKSNAGRKAYKAYSDKIEESLSILGQIEEAKIIQHPVGIDVEETERNIERIQVVWILFDHVFIQMMQYPSVQ